MSCDNAIITPSQKFDDNEFKPFFMREKTMDHLAKIVNITILIVAVACYVLMVLQAFGDLF